ncbi:MAG: AraC family transcriptional regulator [Gemmiger sp.]|nr:AraC family transcriptional regulator [Gemmiger sp.]
MPKTRNFPEYYDPSSEREIVTPSPFGRKNLLFLQEAGHIKLVKSHAGTQRSSLDSYLIVAVVAGSGSLQYDGRNYPLRAGQCFWVDCRHPHGYRSAPREPWELRWVHFNGHSAPAFHHLFEGAGGPVFTPLDFEGVARRLEAVLAAARGWDAPAELRANAELAALLAGILNELAHGEEGTAAAAARLEEVRAWLGEHCAEVLSLDGLAARFYISKYYLARSFKQRYGETIFAFINAARIDNAKQLLRYTDLSMGQIAQRCGYKEQSYFTRRFRAAEGQTAQQYRRAWQSRAGKK